MTLLKATCTNSMQSICARVHSQIVYYTEWPKKVSHYQVSSLNRIKTVITAKFFMKFDYKMSTRI